MLQIGWLFTDLEREKEIDGSRFMRDSLPKRFFYLLFNSFIYRANGSVKSYSPGRSNGRRHYMGHLDQVFASVNQVKRTFICRLSLSLSLKQQKKQCEDVCSDPQKAIKYNFAACRFCVMLLAHCGNERVSRGSDISFLTPHESEKNKTTHSFPQILVAQSRRAASAGEGDARGSRYREFPGSP